MWAELRLVWSPCLTWERKQSCAASIVEVRADSDAHVVEAPTGSVMVPVSENGIF